MLKLFAAPRDFQLSVNFSVSDMEYACISLFWVGMFVSFLGWHVCVVSGLACLCLFWVGTQVVSRIVFANVI